MDQIPLSYEMVCKFVGQLYLESRQAVEQAQVEASKAKTERDQALSLLTPHREG